MGSNDDLRNVVAAAEAGKVHSAVHKVVPLEETASAHEEMERSEHFGKFVIAVS